jgi:hypothetical protein
VPAAAAATAQGGRITLTAAGDLRYEPPFSTSLASDTYGYTLTDGTTASASITFTVNLAGDVVYVADQSPAPEDGTAARPFDTLADAIAVTGGHPIHIRRAPGDGTLTAGITLTAGDKLLGEGVALTSAQVGAPAGDTLFAAGTKPVLTASGVDVVTLAGSTEVAGLSINPDGAGGGLAGTNPAGVTVRDVDITDTGTQATQAGIELTTGGSLTFSGTVSITSTVARALDITGTTLSGTLASTSVTGGTNGGVRLASTTGSLTFQALSITTTGGTGFLLSTVTNLDVDGANFAASVGSTGGPAVDATGLASGSDLVFDSVTAAGTLTKGVNLDGTGTWTFSGAAGSIAASSQVGFDVNGGSGAVSYAGPIANGTGRPVDVTGRAGNTTISGNITGSGGTGINVANNTAGTTTFSGTTKTLNTGTNAAVTLSSNTGHTINFTGGGLDIDTTTGAGFSATGGGTVTVQGTGNTIDSVSAAALNIANTTIGSSNVTFQSVSSGNSTAAADPANGIVLNSTGTAAGNGGLVVTGTGGTCTAATPTCTGGTIQSLVGADDSSFTPVGTGIVLTSTRIPSLTSMRVRNASNYAIRGNQVTNFALSNMLIDGTNGTNVASPFSDGSISFDTILGTNSISTSEISGGVQRNIRVDHASGVGGGTMTLNVTGNNIHDTVGSSPDDGVFVEAENTDNYTVNVANNTLTNHGGDHVNITMINSATINVSITGNTLSNPELPVRLGGGIFVFGASWNGTGTYNVSNNSILRNRQGGAIHMNKGSGTGTLSGSVTNNTIGITGVNKSGSIEASGIIIAARGASGTHTALVEDNNIFGWNDRAIILENGEGSPTLNATVRGNTANTFDPINGLHGLHADLGIISGDAGSVCLDAGGSVAADRNHLTLAGNEAQGGADIRVRRGQAVNLRMPGYAGGADDDAAVSTYLSGRNDVTSLSITSPGTGTYSGGAAACPLP